MVLFWRVLWAMVPALLPALALAQAGGIDWVDVDCSKSRIWPTNGLHCRTTAELTRDAFSTGPGHYRFWKADGTVENVKYYYYLIEAVSTDSGVVSKQELPDALRLRSPQAKGSIQMSDVRQLRDADYVSFQSAAKEACVGIRKAGQGAGQIAGQDPKWVLYATRCVPAGLQITQADLDAFVREARLRD